MGSGPFRAHKGLGASMHIALKVGSLWPPVWAGDHSVSVQSLKSEKTLRLVDGLQIDRGAREGLGEIPEDSQAAALQCRQIFEVLSVLYVAFMIAHFRDPQFMEITIYL